MSYFSSLVSNNLTYTYIEVDKIANRLSHWAINAGLKSGDSVGLLMENCPEFIISWLGLSKIGITVALLSTVVEGALLSHAVSVSACQRVFVSPRYINRVLSCELPSKMPVYIIPNSESIIPSPLSDSVILIPTLSDLDFPSSRPSASLRTAIQSHDAHVLIFTSGTTGRSKAARFNHRRFIGAGITWGRHMRMSSADKYYQSLPLFHGNGGVVAISTAWRFGIELVIREKFSASNFFKDIKNFKCTATITVGELWRYVCAQPRDEELDRSHGLRVACGNGLRPETWRQVVSRFGVKLLVEHYGQTEMPSAHPMINSFMRVGSCGFIPPSVRGHLGTECLVQWDNELQTAKRDACTGRMLLAVSKDDGSMEGEAIVALSHEGAYSGYTSLEATDKVIYKNVFKEGDAWYHSGDILKIDKYGFVYFIDRGGDTYRYKGENVATTEVAEVLEAASKSILQEVNVIGINLPGREADGGANRAGLASVLLHDGVSVHDALSIIIKASTDLPPLARPIFIRIRSKPNEVTGTLKYQKFEILRNGLNPANLPEGDRLFCMMDVINRNKCVESHSFVVAEANESWGYVEMNQDIFENLKREAIRVL